MPETQSTASRYKISTRSSTAYAGNKKWIADSEDDIKNVVFFQYVRTSRLSVSVALESVPLVPKSGIPLVANGFYQLNIQELVLHTQLMTWNRLIKHYRNLAIKGVLKSLLMSRPKRRTGEPKEDSANSKDETVFAKTRFGSPPQSPSKDGPVKSPTSALTTHSTSESSLTITNSGGQIATTEKEKDRERLLFGLKRK